MQSHFVTFLSPGTFVAEETTKRIKSWSVETARRMARSIVERYYARPYAFYFSTRARGPKDLDSKVVKRSALYFLGGKIETIEEIRKREPDSILLRNMEANRWNRVWCSTKGWKWYQPIGPKDVILPEGKRK